MGVTDKSERPAGVAGGFLSMAQTLNPPAADSRVPMACVRFRGMDHACHQCGQEIEEGTPFCRHCGAPQIRIPGLEEAATPPMPPGTPGEVQPPAEPVVIG